MVDVLVDLFGAEVLVFILGHVMPHLDYVSYLQFLRMQNRADTFRQAWAVTHKTALTALETRYREYRQINSDYRDREVQRRVMNKVKRHLENSPSKMYNNKYNEFRQLFKARKTSELQSLAKWFDNEIDVIHRAMHNDMKKICPCLPQP